MSELLPFLITGLVTGSLYGLAGIGIVLTYRTSGVFNFGHGAIAAAAAFVFYTLHDTHHVPWPLAALITLGLFSTVVGFLLERLTRSLADAPEAVVVVATTGLLLGIEGLLYLIYGDLIRNFPAFLPSSGFTVDNVNVSWAEVISVALASTGTAVLFVFLRVTNLGVAMRAVVDNPTLTSLSGARPFRIRAAAWSIGSGFAALSGILLAPTLGLDPNLLTLLVVQAFGACAIGLFTSLPMTYAGGLLVGVVASVATKYLTTPPFSGIPPTVPYLFLIVILLVVPASRLPQRRASIRSLIPEVPPMRKARAWTLGGASAVILLFIPVLVGPRLPVWTSGLTYSVILGSLALLVWVSGQISLCHMAFAAVGATTMAHLDHHLPWGLALLLAGVVAAPVGVLVAIPSARMSGIYLALLTLGFGILMQNVIFPTFLMFGTTLQVKATRPRFWFIDGSDRWFYYVTLLVAALTYWVLAALYRGQLGRLLRAMSETPTMLTTHGLSVSTTRLLVFSISAFLAGIGGALLVTQSGVVAGEAFGPIQSLILLAVLAICGTRLLRSPILAAILLAVAPAYVTRFGVDQQTFGFGLFAVVAALVIAKRSQVQEWLAMAATSSASRQGRGPVINNVRARPSVPPTGANPAVSQ